MYTRNGDRMHNFKRAAEAARITPETALMGMMAKHSVSITDAVDDIEFTGTTNYEKLRESITDCRNYLMLLLALAEERRSVQSKGGEQV